MSVALSLRQPWAWMVVHGGKGIENRRWNTNRRGRFLIHAAKGMTRGEYEDALYFARDVDPQIVVPPMAELARGGIIGSAVLHDVIPPCQGDSLFYKPCEHPWHMAAQYGFVLRDVASLPFRPLRGELGFFHVPDDALGMPVKGTGEEERDKG